MRDVSRQFDLEPPEKDPSNPTLTLRYDYNSVQTNMIGSQVKFAYLARLRSEKPATHPAENGYF